VSYIEIYKDDVYDLLVARENVRLRFFSTRATRSSFPSPVFLQSHMLTLSLLALGSETPRARERNRRRLRRWAHIHADSERGRV
jgi:hypothetical protein